MFRVVEQLKSLFSSSIFFFSLTPKVLVEFHDDGYWLVMHNHCWMISAHILALSFGWSELSYHK